MVSLKNAITRWWKSSHLWADLRPLRMGRGGSSSLILKLCWSDDSRHVPMKLDICSKAQCGELSKKEWNRSRGLVVGATAGHAVARILTIKIGWFSLAGRTCLPPTPWGNANKCTVYYLRCQCLNISMYPCATSGSFEKIGCLWSAIFPFTTFGTIMLTWGVPLALPALPPLSAPSIGTSPLEYLRQ